MDDAGERRRRAGRALAATGGVGRVPIEGHSMAPLLQPGDAVRVALGAAPRWGDVVVAWAGTALVAHRVVGRRSGGALVMRGDAAARADAPVAAEDVVGRVTAVEGPDGRRLDGAWARAVGIAAASLGGLGQALGTARPRPAAVVRAALALEARLLPRRAEDALLLLLCRPVLDDGAVARACALLDGPLDWADLEARALRAQLGPLAWYGLGRLVRDHGAPVPPEARAALARHAVASARRWAEQRAILSAIAARLGAAGIPVLAHKGAALALAVYADPALRIAGDLDLSVPDADRARAEALVADLRDPLVAANPDRRAAWGHHVELDGTAHHDVEPSGFGSGRWAAGRLDWEEIWQRAAVVDVDGWPLRIPAPTDLLLTLIANAVRRGFSPPRQLVDIAHAVHAGGARVDWDALAAELRRTRLDRRAWLALGLARDWLGADVPAALLEPPSDLRMAAWERLALRAKHRRPLLRLPTRVLWAGSGSEAVRQAVRLAASRGPFRTQRRRAGEPLEAAP